MHKQVRVPFCELESFRLLLYCSPAVVKCFGTHLDPHMFLFFLGDDPEYLITGTHAYPSGPGKYVNTLANGL